MTGKESKKILPYIAPYRKWDNGQNWDPAVCAENSRWNRDNNEIRFL